MYIYVYKNIYKTFHKKIRKKLKFQHFAKRLYEISEVNGMSDMVSEFTEAQLRPIFQQTVNTLDCLIF